MTAAPALTYPCPQPSPAPRFSVIPGGLGRGDDPELELRRGIESLLPYLHRRARYLTKGSESAHDLVQDTIERAFKFAQSYESGSNLRAWLFQVMYSVFASQCRRAQRHRNAVERMATEATVWGKSTSSQPTYPGLSRTLERQLLGLPASFARVVWLIDVQELSYKEAAEQLDIPIGTIMSRLHRARRLLRERLERAA